jgi:hypothetical protein
MMENKKRKIDVRNGMGKPIQKQLAEDALQVSTAKSGAAVRYF